MYLLEERARLSDGDHGMLEQRGSGPALSWVGRQSHPPNYLESQEGQQMNQLGKQSQSTD